MKNFFYRHVFNFIAAYAVALLVGAWFLLKRLPEWIRSLRAGAWPSVQGRVETVNVTTFHDQALAELGYSYVVEGERFAGYCTRQFADEQHAWDYVDGLQGQLVVVRFEEKDPGISALRAEDQQSYVNIQGDGFFISFWKAVFERLTQFYPRRL